MKAPSLLSPIRTLLILPTVLVLMIGGATAFGAESSHKPLAGKHVLFLVADRFQDAETFFPMGYLAAQGASITVAGLAPGTVGAYNSDATIEVETTVAELQIDSFDALVIPGGGSPGNLRQDEDLVRFTAAFFKTGRPVAAICHGPQLLVTAGVMEGLEATCFSGMSRELEEAGARYIDQPLVRDGNLITSRLPEDLAPFSRAIAEAMTEGG